MYHQIEREKGVPVLRLPAKGTDLQEGRQYELDPIARAYVLETYGLLLPKIVECLFKKTPPMRYATHALNLETGEARWSVIEQDGREATFRCFMTINRIEKFCLDLENLHAARSRLAKSHKADEIAERDEVEQKSSRKREKKPVPVIDVLALLGDL